MSAETREFQTEVQRLLELMIHSLYTNKEIFLRELISNASDALDRRRFAGVTEPALLPNGEFAIALRADPEARTLVVSDNGIGMTRDEVVENLGTIARSGTREFLAQLEGKGGGTSPDLIGQFGVGFYSSFMVAKTVEVVTRKAGETAATRWYSAGHGRYELDDAERDEAGTTITLTLEEVDGEAGIEDFTDEWILRRIVKKHSDFVAYPIRLEIVGKEEAEGPAEALNSMKAIWTRPGSEVSEEEYKEFYRHISHDFNEPLLHFDTRLEGTFEAKALLYLPERAPFDLYHREMAHRGIQLYVKRVFIMDECRELMPEYLRFVKGVVDSEDLSLNISRETLQQDRQIQAIRKHLVKKVLEALSKLKKDDREKYLQFWSQFGPVVKEGLLGFEDKKERILELMMAATTRSESGGLTSLDEYLSHMAEDQDCIYYLCGPSLETVRRSPHLEAFKDRDIEVLLFADPVDEVWLHQMPPEYKGKRWQSVGKGEISLDGAREAETPDAEREEVDARYRDLVAKLRTAIQDEVKEVRLSRRLTSSPACLVAEEGDLSPQMEAMLRQAGQEVPERKPILELNPDHPLVEKLRALCEDDAAASVLEDYAQLLFGQAVLAEGRALRDPADYSRRVAEMMARAL